MRASGCNIPALGAAVISTSKFASGAKKYVLALVHCLLVSGCMVPGEAFLRIQGTIVDTNGKPVSACVVSVIDINEQMTILEKSTTSGVDLHLVNPPIDGQFIVAFKCAGFDKTLQMGEFKFADYSLVNPLQLGRVIIVN